MQKLKKIPTASWGRDVTLQLLWELWMEQNGIKTVEAAQALFKTHGIRGVKSLPLWLQNTPTVDLLTTGMNSIQEETGIDIDAWMVCEAKRQIWDEYPELRKQIDFKRDIHREDVINLLRKQIETYGGHQYLALQMNIPSSTIGFWNKGAHKPRIEMIKVVLINLMRGFLSIACLEDAQFILMSRAILGGDPQEFFPGITDFASALKEFLRPYPRHTAVKIESLTGIKENTVSRLLEWKPEPGKTSCNHETVEGVLRVLVERSYPALVETFDEHRKTYRKKEDAGIWEVEVPLKDLMNHAPVEKQCEETKVQPKPIVVPVVSAPAPAPNPIMPSKETYEDVVIDGLEALVARLKTHRTETTTTQQTSPTHKQIGSVIDGVEHCLDPSSWHLRSGERVSEEEVERVRKAIVQLRKVLCVLCELDPEFIRKMITPILSDELAELFVAQVGLEHLLGTKAAWEIVQGTRSMVRVASGVNGKNANSRRN